MLNTWDCQLADGRATCHHGGHEFGKAISNIIIIITIINIIILIANIIIAIMLRSITETPC